MKNSSLKLIKLSLKKSKEILSQGLRCKLPHKNAHLYF